jgi:hypothetical protein
MRRDQDGGEHGIRGEENRRAVLRVTQKDADEMAGDDEG